MVPSTVLFNIIRAKGGLHFRLTGTLLGCGVVWVLYKCMIHAAMRKETHTPGFRISVVWVGTAIPLDPKGVLYAFKVLAFVRRLLP